MHIEFPFLNGGTKRSKLLHENLHENLCIQTIKEIEIIVF